MIAISKMPIEMMKEIMKRRDFVKLGQLGKMLRFKIEISVRDAGELEIQRDLKIAFLDCRVHGGMRAVFDVSKYIQGLLDEIANRQHSNSNECLAYRVVGFEEMNILGFEIGIDELRQIRASQAVNCSIEKGCESGKN